MNWSARDNNSKVFIITLFCVFHVFAKAAVQDTNCALLISPAQDEINVSIAATISFQPVAGAVNYFVDLGTTPGGTDILNNFSVNVSASFVPPLGLPETTTIFITIRPFFVSGSQTCSSQSFTTEDVITIPACTQSTFPVNEAIGVPIDTSISWLYATRATGYIINIGTTAGGTDVINGQNVGNVLTFNNPNNLESETTYYVTIIPFNENGQTLGCTETSFTTEAVASEVPNCTQLIAPLDGAVEVALTSILEWEPVNNVEGYLIKVGSFSGGDNVLANTNIGLLTSTAILDFLEGTTYYVTISPFNAAGVASGCIETSFTTTFGCGPYIDSESGELVDLNPIIDLEERYEICQEETPLILNFPDSFTSISWVKIEDGSAILQSSDAFISITTSGTYMLEVTTEMNIDAGIIFCTSTHFFEVSIFEPPIIENLIITNQGNTVTVFVEVQNQGDFEYSSMSANGPFQSNPLLTNVNATDIQVFVRDRGGCGSDFRRLRPDPGFPKYFTPNGDGINDTWQVRGVIVNGQTITSIEIYDRFGKRLQTILPQGPGWDGLYRGRRLLDNGYWYKANTLSNTVFTGHFALRR